MTVKPKRVRAKAFSQMTETSPARAVEQVRSIEMMCGFMANPKIKAAVEQSVPVSMPAEAGSLGFDIPLWVGLRVGWHLCQKLDHPPP
jgi:hypothetical protein